MDHHVANQNGLTDAQLRASPIPVSATIDTTGLALEAGHLAELSAQILDLDTGGGTDNTVGFFIALPASGGAVAGGTSVNPLVVSVTGSIAVTNTGTFAVQDSAAETSLSVIDDWDEGDRAKVNLIVGQAGIAAGAGAVGVTVPRMTLASDDPAVTSLATPAVVYNGKKTVTTAGTRVTLASSQAVKSVTIKALSTNTGFIYVGDGSVASTNGFQLERGESVSLDIANLTTVNLDSSVNGEGVTYIGV